MKPHSKDELLTSNVKKGETRHGPGYDGVPRHFTKPGEPGLIAHPHAVVIVAGQKEQTNVHADLGVTPKIKHAHQVANPIHDGMMAKSTKDGTHFSGLSGQDLSHYDADPGNALSGREVMGGNLPMGKRLTPPKFAPGMRSRANDALSSGYPGTAHAKFTDEHRAALHELGRAVLREAVESGGRIKFPQATDENT